MSSVHPSSSRLAYQMCASPSFVQDQTAVDLVDRGQIPSPSAVSGFAGDEPWTKSGEVDPFDLEFDPLGSLTCRPVSVNL